MARGKKTAAKTTSKRRRPQPPPPLRENGGVFGPEFFAQVLPRMVRALPGAERHPPSCYVHLGNGDVLDVAETLAVADRFVVLAVFEGAGEDGVERTEDDIGVEAIPYDLILRVSARRAATHQAPLGFRLNKAELAVISRSGDVDKPRPKRRRRDAAEVEAPSA